jgi:hypothetical protein
VSAKDVILDYVFEIEGVGGGGAVLRDDAEVKFDILG